MQMSGFIRCKLLGEAVRGLKMLDKLAFGGMMEEHMARVAVY